MLTIGPHPANRRLHVLDLGRPWRLIHDAVLPGDTDIAMLGHAYTVALFEGSAVGGLPSTPRQKEETLHRTWSVCWSKDIDCQRTPCNGMNDHIFFNANVRHHHLLSTCKVVVDASHVLQQHSTMPSSWRPHKATAEPCPLGKARAGVAGVIYKYVPNNQYSISM